MKYPTQTNKYTQTFCGFLKILNELVSPWGVDSLSLIVCQCALSPRSNPAVNYRIV